MSIQQNTKHHKVACYALITMMISAVTLLVSANPSEAFNIKPSLIEAEEARPPIGYLQFCEQFPAECVEKIGLSRVQYSDVSMRELSLVNAYVNEAIKPVSDNEQYGVAELWTYPTDSGDCEDYVLLKRRVLIDRGWPEEALMITVVRQPNGEGHSVLTVATDEGDYILDNLSQAVLPWNETQYEYLKRQSIYNPNRWVWLDIDKG